MLSATCTIKDAGSPFEVTFNSAIEVTEVDHDNGLLYVAGSFTQVTGANGTFTRQRLCCIDLATGEVTSFEPFTSATATTFRALLIRNGLLYVGGVFTLLNGLSRRGMVRIDLNTGTMDSFNLNATGGASAVLFVAGDDNTPEGPGVWVVGQFGTVLGVSRDSVCFIKDDGTLGSYSVSVSGDPEAVGVLGDFIFFGGDFTTFAGSSRDRICRVRRSNWTLDSWSPVVTGETVDDGLIITTPRPDVVYFNKNLATVDGFSRSSIVGLNATIGVSPVVSGFDPQINPKPVYGNTVYDPVNDKIAMRLESRTPEVQGSVRAWIAMLDPDTGAPSTWQNADAERASQTPVAVWGGRLYYRTGTNVLYSQPTEYVTVGRYNNPTDPNAATLLNSGAHVILPFTAALEGPALAGGTTFTIPASGAYKITGHYYAKGLGSGRTFKLALYVNGVNTHEVTLVSGTGNQVIGPFGVIAALNIGDQLRVEAWITAGATVDIGPLNWQIDRVSASSVPLPGMPAVTSAHDHQLDTTPTWNWTSGGGGVGTYRYKLDDPDLSAGATETTDTFFTPGAPLSYGAHVLYVQEYNGAGGWSSSGSYSVTVVEEPTALLAELAFHVDAFEHEVELDGTEIDTTPDLAGGANLSSTGNGPAKGTDARGIPYLSFDGVDDHLSRAASFISGSSVFEVFLVTESSATPRRGYCRGLGTWSITLGSDGFATSTGTDYNLGVISGWSPNGLPTIVRGLRDSTLMQMDQWVNGNGSHSLTMSSSNLRNSATGDALARNGVSSFFNVKVYGVLGFLRRLTGPETTSLILWLRAKYRVPAA